MKRIQLLLLLCLGWNISSKAQNWLWAHQSKNDNTYSYSTATDASGNVYVTGYFMNSVDFDGHMVTSSGGRDIYVAKYNSNGGLQWIQTAGCNKPNVLEQGTDIATDANGNVYVTGDFGDTANFDGMQINATPAIVANATNCFVAKYNTAGVIQWVKPIGSTAMGAATGFGIAVDGNNDLLVTGTYYGTTSVDTISIGGCSNCSNVFVAKFNPTGHALWARSSNASTLVIDFGRTVATDAQNNVIIAGQMTGANDFGTTSLAGFGGSDIFIAKYDASGNFLWAKQAGSPAPGDDLKGLGTDAAGNIYLSGNFTGNSQFGALSLSGPAAGTDIFIAKMDPSGSFTWVKKADAPSTILMHMYTNSTGDSYLSALGLGGVFGGLNPGSGSFILKYDNSGAGVALKMMPTFSNSFAVALHPSGDIITAGIVSGSNAIFSNDTLSGNGFTTNMFVARLHGMTTGIEQTTTQEQGLSIYPNPAADHVVVAGKFNKNAFATIRDLSGKFLLQQAVVPCLSFQMDLRQVPSGIYFLQVFDGSQSMNRKLVVSH